jgi:hypothetical protein
MYDANNSKSLANDRIINDDNEIIKSNADIVLVSWCGKKNSKKLRTKYENQ